MSKPFPAFPQPEIGARLPRFPWASSASLSSSRLWNLQVLPEQLP